MAIVTENSNLIGDIYAGISNPDPVFCRGRPIMATGSVTNAATDSSGSKYLLAKIPSQAILGSRTLFDVEALGFATVNIGTETDIDALVTIAKSSGNTVTPVVFGDAKHGLHLWQVLGLAADPNGMIGIWQHASGNATGAGSMPFQFEYFMP